MRAVAMVVLIVSGGGAFAQGPRAVTAPLSGVVRDVSGAVMQSVDVRVFDASDPVSETVTDARGAFRVDLPPGDYRIEVVAPAFEAYAADIALRLGAEPIEVVLELAPVGENLVVNATVEQLIADTSMSLLSTTLSGDELLGLPSTEEELAVYLMLLAGADTTGDLEEDILSNFTIDGFDDGRLPRLDQIQQIIIDPNSLSADGGGARIEIITRPGSDRWRRSIGFDFADEALNALTPGESRKEPRQTRDADVSVQGPLIPDFLEIDIEASTRVDERAGNSLRAVTPTESIFRGVVLPEREEQFAIEGDINLADGHTLHVQYEYERSRSENSGVGGFTLPERGADEGGSTWSIDVRHRTFGENHTNDFQFRVRRRHDRSVPINEGYAVDVAGSFNGGGGTERNIDRNTRYQAENRLRWERGEWRFQWGVETAYAKNSELFENNFNGTYEFASLHDYCLATGFDGTNCAETRRIVADARTDGDTPAYLDGRGREVAITGTPTTFTQASGNGLIRIDTVAFDTFFQIDRGFGERASLRMGLSYGATNHSVDFLRVNPTLNFQYRPFADTLISIGTQIDFRDFQDYERLMRYDGRSHLFERSVSAPSFPEPFAGEFTEVDADDASLWLLDPAYQSPYTARPQLSVNQDVPGGVRLALSFSWNLGVHQQRTRNVNAPYPGTPLPDELLALPRDERQDIVDRMRPFYPVVGNMYQIESTGRSIGRDLRFRIQPRRDLILSGLRVSGEIQYRYRSADDDNDFNNPYVRLWGPGRRQHQVQSRFRIRLPEDAAFGNAILRSLARATYAGTNFNFDFQANTGNLYSLRTGADLNGDQSTRDRPPGVARNTEVGPGRWNVDMTFTKEFYVGTAAGIEGEERASGERRGRRGRGPREGETRVRFQARVSNLLNHSQPRSYNGVLTSPLFGQPTGFSGGRTIRLSMNVDF